MALAPMAEDGDSDARVRELEEVCVFVCLYLRAKVRELGEVCVCMCVCMFA